MNVVVQELGASKGGKPKVKANGVWYFLNDDVSPTVGQSIEIKTGSFSIDGKTFQTIEAWRPPQNGQGQAPARQGTAAPSGKSDYLQEAELRYISNIMAKAIESKLITEPAQLLSWYQGAKAAHEGKPAAIPFNDNIPIGRVPGSDDEGYEQMGTAAGGRW